MLKASFFVALSIFLTCTMFFVIYGLAYLGIRLGIYASRKIKDSFLKEIKKE